MRSAAVVTAGLALVVLLAVAPSRRADAQILPVACTGSTSSVGHSPEYDDFFWVGITGCAAPIPKLGVLTGLFRYDWEDDFWQFERIVGGNAATGSFVGRNGFVNVTPYLGANCVRASSYHWVASQITFDDSISVSVTQCY